MKPAKLACAVGVIGLLAVAGAASAQSTTTGKAPAVSALPAAIPIFPLPDMMLFPEMSVPLHIFEPRYRAMVADALKGDRIIGMVLLRPGYEPDYERSPSIFPIGCAGTITNVEALPNGEYNIVLESIVKFRIDREETGKLYRVARVTAIPEVLSAKEKTDLDAQRLALDKLLIASGGRLGLGRVPSGLSDEELVNGVAQFARIDPLERLKLLEQPNALARVRLLIDLLENPPAPSR
jgi:Lon protease-like protein